MRRMWIVLGVVCCLASLSWASAWQEGEREVKPRIVSVSLFKNGLAVVKRQIDLNGPGSYVIKDVPEPVHGTFHIESQGSMDAQMTLRQRPIDKPTPLGVSLQEELAGLKVTIHGRNTKTPIVGTVKAATKVEADDPDTPPDYRGYRPTPEPNSRFLILETEKGTSYIDLGEIAAMEIDGKPKPMVRTEKKPVLLLTTKEGNAKLAQISCLEHGLSWAPSYRVDLTDAKKLSIEQQAVIRNELTDLADTDIQLISGYPSVQFANVTSPLVATQTWARFFQQLNSRGGGSQFDNGMISQQSAVYSNSARGFESASPAVAPNIGDTIDLNYHSIGKRTLRKGAAISLTTAQATTDYERIVDWLIPDTRDEWGNPSNRNRAVDPNTGDPLQDDVWDALKFKNPLPFPMTTAPAMVTTAGNFSGQRQVLWTNKGEESTLRINKALSIRARHVEYENQVGGAGNAERDVIWLAGRRFRKVTLNAELRLCNHRGADAKLIIKRHFSGDLVNAEGNPKIDLREEGAWTVNKRNELVWTFTMKPSEEKTVKYQYTVLINF